MKILVTGGAGFIGGNFVHHMVNKYPDYEIVNLDLLTYAGNLETLKPVEDKPNYKFVKGDIADREFIMDLFEKEKFDIVVNFAAESHVDRSIEDPSIFVKTNVEGTVVLLDAAKKYGVKRYHQVSTDEVYGDLPLDRPDLFFTETTPLHTSSPYSSSKASADLFVLAYHRTFVSLFCNFFILFILIKMLKQLRTISFPREADSTNDQPCLSRRRTSSLWKR